MISYFRNLLLAIQAIGRHLAEAVDALHGLIHALPEGSAPDEDLDKRVAALERELERRHAEAEGLLLKAQGKFDAARASEERARRLKESSGGSDEGNDDLTEDDILAAYEEAGVPLGDDGGGQENGVPPVRGRLATRHESRRNAYAMKFGR